MKKTIWVAGLLLAGALLTSCGTKENTTSDPAAVSSAQSTEQPTSEADIATTSAVSWPYYQIAQEGEIKGYLLGTVHLGSPEMYPFPETMLSQLESCENFITELGDELSDSTSSLTEADLLAVEPITTTMTDESRKTYQAVLASYDLTEEDLAPYNRYAVNTVFLQLVMAEITDETTGNLAVSAEYGVDQQLTAHHQELTGQKSIGLETLEEQEAIMKQSFELPEDINEWVATLMTKEEYMASSGGGAAVVDYIAGRQNFSEQNPQADEIMVYDRNEAWAAKLPEYLQQEQQSFIAVGAGHLPGERGLVQLLQQAGYDVTAVTFSN